MHSEDSIENRREQDLHIEKERKGKTKSKNEDNENNVASLGNEINIFGNFKELIYITSNQN